MDTFIQWNLDQKDLNWREATSWAPQQLMNNLEPEQSPLLLEPYNPSATEAGTGSGLSFPPPGTCGCRNLVSFPRAEFGRWCIESRSLSAERPHPVAFSDWPLSPFSVSGEIFSIAGGKKSEWQLCWFLSILVDWALHRFSYQVSFTSSLNTVDAEGYLSFYSTVNLWWVLIIGSEKATGRSKAVSQTQELCSAKDALCSRITFISPENGMSPGSSIF